MKWQSRQVFQPNYVSIQGEPDGPAYEIGKAEKCDKLPHSFKSVSPLLIDFKGSDFSVRTENQSTKAAALVTNVQLKYRR